MSNTHDNAIEEAKRLARAELDEYRESRRREREARTKANETAEEEIARAIHQRREDEARQAETSAAHARFMEKRYAEIEAMRAAERAGRASGDFRVGPVAPPAARRVAQLLRQRLGDDFNAIVADIRGCDWRSFQNEVERVLVDEECERKHREQQAREAAMAEAAKTLPDPEDAAEAALLAKHGFAPDGLVPELDRVVA